MKALKSNNDLHVTRILGHIAQSNTLIDGEDRLMLAKSIASANQLDEGQADLLLESMMSDHIDETVAELTDHHSLRHFLFNLMTLAIVKHDWDSGELAAARRVVKLVRLPARDLDRLLVAFDNLVEVGKNMVHPLAP